MKSKLESYNKLKLNISQFLTNNDCVDIIYNCFILLLLYVRVFKTAYLKNYLHFWSSVYHLRNPSFHK
jgi:hypothetical protein